MRHIYCSHAAGEKEEDQERRGFFHSALYCPPLKTIGTDVSVVPAQKTSLSHTLAAVTLAKHRAMVGKISNLAWIFFFYYYFWNHFPPPVDAPLPSCLCCVTANTWFNSVTYGAPRGISPCLSCQYGFVCDCACLRLSANLALACVSVSVKLIYSRHPSAHPGSPPVRAPSMSNFPGFVRTFFSFFPLLL